MTDADMNLEGQTLEAKLVGLRDEHKELDARIVGLANRPYLTPEEQLEVARLKKLKLRKKEQIYQVAQQLGVEP